MSFEQLIHLGGIKLIEVDGRTSGDFISDRRLQESDGRTNACALGHDDL